MSIHGYLEMRTGGWQNTDEGKNRFYFEHYEVSFYRGHGGTDFTIFGVTKMM